MKIAGLDIGSSGCKLTVFDEEGNNLARSYRDYPVTRASKGHEVDITVMMQSALQLIREMAERFPDIGGIGVTSFGETFVMTDAEGNPLHNGMIYTDNRGAEECAELGERLGRSHIAEVTGLMPHQMYSIGKMMWIRKHRPEVYAAAKHIYLIQDYVVWYLTGEAQIDYSLAARTMAFDISRLCWSGEIFESAGIDMSLMSRPVPTGSCAGRLRPKALEETGLSKDCVIVSVSHDQVAAAVGAGAFDGSTAVDGAGTTECLLPVYDSLPDIKIMNRGYYSIIPYILPGKYVTYAFSYTGGALINWCIRTFCPGEGYDSMEAAYSGEGPTGLLVLPHFAGAATPYMDNGCRGAVVGLSLENNAADIYRACMEGVAYEMRLNYEALKGSGIHFTRINATGGGARSRAWMQIKADILNLPVRALKTPDAGTVGSAMLTGIATGVFKDLRDAADHMVQENGIFLPDPAMHSRYMECYERYRKLYDALRPLM